MKKVIQQLRFHHIFLFATCLIIMMTSYYIFGIHQGDLRVHIEKAEAIANSPISVWIHDIGHPLWHFCVLFCRSFGLSIGRSARLVSSFSKALSLLMIYMFYQRTMGSVIKPVWNVVLAFITVVVSAVWIPTINPGVYHNGGSPNPWHSPTQMLMVVIMLPCVYYLTQNYDHQLKKPDQCILTWKQILAISVMLALSTLAKPIFVQCFFPGAAVYFLFQWIKRPQLTRYYCGLLISLIPTIVIILFQLYSYYGDQSDTGIKVGIHFATIAKNIRTTLMITAFPMFTLLCTIKKQKGCAIPIAVLTTLCACIESCLFDETGARTGHGNWGWGVYAGALLMWIVAMPEYVKLLVPNKKWKTRVFRICATGLLLWHFASGIYYMYLLIFIR